MTYADAVSALYALGNEVRTARLGLDRISAVLARLGDPQRACRFVHVAGTNGKGSVCAMVEAGLRKAGTSTGLYTSPHLVEPLERIQIAGRPVSRDEFTCAFARVHAAAQGTLTYFESVTAMAFLLFRDREVDTVVLEVGLGGRLDATNVVSPELCVITRV
ncbi:MAG TPA: bifunctional folylpolyglutamate synthase/dihydrofolate synthase, partial [Bryobacteraceae bacterium]|nr:bifunctional folylpolyglutamate synthase/dihydrofolate synthase [Bryobacteraceae bacterium]